MSVVSEHSINLAKIRSDFPILSREVNGKPLVYFDNAATTQKPAVVIDALSTYYKEYNANIHRGIHTLAEAATAAFEASRKVASGFIGSAEPEEIIFTKGTTDSINLVASTYGRKYVGEGDEILLSGLEHHSNIVPWQLLAEEKGAKIRVIPVLADGSLDMEAFSTLLSDRTRIVAVNHASNSLGTINPISEIITKAHEAGAVVLIDGAQAGAHLEINVQELDCDFYATSAHKFYGPTGTGLLYGKRALLEDMPPYQGGGEMIRDVSFEKTTYNDIPYKFEAGTPNIAGVVAMKHAMEYITEIGKPVIAAHEHDLLVYGSEKIMEIPGVKIIGTAAEKVSVLSFIIDGIHPFDIGQMLDARGVAVRTGHHCTQPLMEHFNIEGTIRASFAMYNTRDEIDVMIEGLQKVVKILG